MTDKILALFNKYRRNASIGNMPQYQKAYNQLKKKLAYEINQYIHQQQDEVPMYVEINKSADLDIVQEAFHMAKQASENIKKGVFDEYDIDSLDREILAFKKQIRELYYRYLDSRIQDIRKGA